MVGLIHETSALEKADVGFAVPESVDMGSLLRREYQQENADELGSSKR